MCVCGFLRGRDNERLRDSYLESSGSWNVMRTRFFSRVFLPAVPAHLWWRFDDTHTHVFSARYRQMFRLISHRLAVCAFVLCFVWPIRIIIAYLCCPPQLFAIEMWKLYYTHIIIVSYLNEICSIYIMKWLGGEWLCWWFYFRVRNQ